MRDSRDDLIDFGSPVELDAILAWHGMRRLEGPPGFPRETDASVRERLRQLACILVPDTSGIEQAVSRLEGRGPAPPPPAQFACVLCGGGAHEPTHPDCRARYTGLR